MEFQWLNTFITAADCGNFRRTAELLFISQPSVTVHIKQLEKELGVQLFSREGKKIKLTEEGKRYLFHAKRLLEVYQRGLEDLSSFSQGYTTKLILGISPIVAETIMPYVLKKFTKQHPKVEISMKIFESIDIEAAVQREEVDLGLSCLSSSDPNLICGLVNKERVLLIAPHDGRDFESAPPLDEEEVLTANYLLTHNHPGYWERLCRLVKNRYPSVRMMKVPRVHITKRFIIEELGVSFLPESTVRRELLEGSLLAVDCHTISLPEANTYAIMKYDHSLQKEFLRFISNYRL